MSRTGGRRTTSSVKVVGTTASTIQGNPIDHNTDSGIGLAQGATGIDLRSPNSVTGNVSHDKEDSGIQVYTGSDGSLVVNNTLAQRWPRPTCARRVLRVGDHRLPVAEPVSDPGRRAGGPLRRRRDRRARTPAPEVTESGPDWSRPWKPV